MFILFIVGIFEMDLKIIVEIVVRDYGLMLLFIIFELKILSCRKYWLNNFKYLLWVCFYLMGWV